MKRSLLVLGLLLAAACHPPSLRDRAHDLGSKMAAVGDKVVGVVTPIAPATPSTDALQTLATDAAKAKVADTLAAQGPLSFHKSVDLSSNEAPADNHPSSSGGSPSTSVTVHRTQAPADIFALRATTAGGVTSCKVYASQDECTSSCTSMMKQASWASLDTKHRDPNLVQSCNCMQEAPGRCK
jgi:hypothetical protein